MLSVMVWQALPVALKNVPLGIVLSNLSPVLEVERKIMIFEVIY
jgi:hypothetical protein